MPERFLRRVLETDSACAVVYGWGPAEACGSCEHLGGRHDSDDRLVFYCQLDDAPRGATWPACSRFVLAGGVVQAEPAP